MFYFITSFNDLCPHLKSQLYDKAKVSKLIFYSNFRFDFDATSDLFALALAIFIQKSVDWFALAHAKRISKKKLIYNGEKSALLIS